MSGPFVNGYGSPTDNPAGFSLPIFQTNYMVEYIRTNRFNKYIGTDGSMPIQLKMEAKGRGESIKIPFLSRMKKRGVTGNMPLAGREEALDRQSHTIRVEQRRNAALLTERDEHMVFARALGQVRPHLMRWSKEQLRDDIIDACFMVQPRVTMHVPLVNPDPTQVLPGDAAIVNIKTQATTPQLNAWLTNNDDRVVFGGLDANLAAGDFATSIGNIALPADRMGAKVLDRLKMKAKLADRHITPITVGEDDEEYFVVFCDSLSFQQAQYDTDIKEFNKSARSREGSGYKRNPMITGGDLEWNGMILREVPEMAPHSSTVGRSVLMGAEAIGVAIGSDPDFRERKEDDYGQLIGVGIREIIGVEKLQMETAPNVFVDHSMVTGFTSLV